LELALVSWRLWTFPTSSFTVHFKLVPACRLHAAAMYTKCNDYINANLCPDATTKQRGKKCTGACTREQCCTCPNPLFPWIEEKNNCWGESMSRGLA